MKLLTELIMEGPALLFSDSFARRSNVEPGVGQSSARKSRPAGVATAGRRERVSVAREGPGLFPGWWRLAVQESLQKRSGDENSLVQFCFHCATYSGFGADNSTFLLHNLLSTCG